jgi:hypothetical protein
MTASDKSNSAAEQKSAERLDVARTAYDALVKQDADRVITLCDVRGRLIARHDPRPEQTGSEIASLRWPQNSSPDGEHWAARRRDPKGG